MINNTAIKEKIHRDPLIRIICSSKTQWAGEYNNGDDDVGREDA